MNTFREHLNQKLRDKDFAQAFHEEDRKLRIAYELHSARTHEKLTQKQLAERAGVTQQMVSRLENAMAPAISLKTISRISGALGLEVGLVQPSRPVAVTSFYKVPTKIAVAKRVSSSKSRSKEPSANTKK